MDDFAKTVLNFIGCVFAAFAVFILIRKAFNGLPGPYTADQGAFLDSRRWLRHRTDGIPKEIKFGC